MFGSRQSSNAIYPSYANLRRSLFRLFPYALLRLRYVSVAFSLKSLYSSHLVVSEIRVISTHPKSGNTKLISKSCIVHMCQTNIHSVAIAHVVNVAENL